MRADFFDRFGPFPEFAKLVEKNIAIVADMQVDELRLAIEQPAAQHGVMFEQGLVEEIIKDVQGQAGSLPLLQYTLDLLWRKEELDGGLPDRHLKAQAYRELGGVRGALQKRADEIYDSFGDEADAKSPSAKAGDRSADFPPPGGHRRHWLQTKRYGAPSAGVSRRQTSRRQQEQEILQTLINQKLLCEQSRGGRSNR